MVTTCEKYQRERELVERLMRRRGLMGEGYLDPSKEAGDESGADVIAIVGGRRIGIQVTELDTGDVAGQARASEKAAWRDAQAHEQNTYGAWAQNDPSKLAAAIARAVTAKMQQVVGCDEAWLLIAASLPELGALASTFVATKWLPADALDSAAASHLAACNYAHAFVHVIVGSEDALYVWSVGGKWNKHTQPHHVGEQGKGFFDLRDNPSELQEWLTDPEGKTDSEVKKVRREYAALRGQGKPLPPFLKVDGEWIIEGFMFLYHLDEENVAAGTFTRQAERYDGQLCIGFNVAQIADTLGVDVRTVIEANQNQTLVPLGTASVPPERGGAAATAYGFKIGDKEGYVTVERYDEGRA